MLSYKSVTFDTYTPSYYRAYGSGDLLESLIHETFDKICMELEDEPGPVDPKIFVGTLYSVIMQKILSNKK